MRIEGYGGPVGPHRETSISLKIPPYKHGGVDEILNRKPWKSPIVLREPEPVVQKKPAPAKKKPLKRAARRPAVRRGRHGPEGASAKVREEVVRRYGEGQGLRSIAKDMGIGYTSARKYVVDAGVQVRPQGINVTRPPAEEPEIRQCQWCGKDIPMTKRKYDYKTRIACSRACASFIGQRRRKD